ncbi:MAG: GTPase HflX [Candidatus Bathyarchaeota archaeon]|nr:GTPase HflX [Candidatus Bathyarchaeota archaeon]
MQRRLRDEPNGLKELESLGEVAGYVTIATVEQIRKPDASFQIGRGKVEELAQLVREKKAEKIIFDNRLKSVQAYNLARETGVEVIDRFQLILEMFTRRASTTEAKLQIQLAKLQNEVAHAKEKVRLARMEEQPGFRGLGAYEVDVYYEAVRRQVKSIQDKLARVKRKRGLHRSQRRKLGFASISLSGYTNAGKSTLFNELVKESVPIGEGLFTTLSTTTRVFNLLGKRILLTDTVGFIDKLPIKLIRAFQSTLEETIFSDLILLVVDGNQTCEEISRKLAVSLETIQRIGAYGIPLVTALNKIDMLSEGEVNQRIETMRNSAQNVVPISALEGENIDLLRQKLAQLLKNYVSISFSIPLSNENLSFISWLYTYTDVKNINYEEDYADVQIEAVPSFSEKVLGQIKKHDGTVKELA